MSCTDALEPLCDRSAPDVALVIEPKTKDLGGFAVRRVLPAPERKTVGPFIFFDEMGPADFPPGEGINVRPHPHIGLATVTYLFEGEILHRDSLGFVQPIRPGAINLMTAGRGIVHSERTDRELERSGQRLHGIQTWMALPDDKQEIEPAFEHVPAADLPSREEAGVITTVIIGDAYGMRSPVRVHAETLYVEQCLGAGVAVQLPETVTERGVYVVDGRVRLGACELPAHRMAVVEPGPVRLEAPEPSRVVIIGGAPMGERHIWWNFVHSSEERIAAAKRDWVNQAFGKVPDDDEYIPLPSE
jgi:redox-sensitive bicupin YhaK (pirin superfamily)